MEYFLLEDGNTITRDFLSDLLLSEDIYLCMHRKSSELLTFELYIDYRDDCLFMEEMHAAS